MPPGRVLGSVSPGKVPEGSVPCGISEHVRFWGSVPPGRVPEGSVLGSVVPGRVVPGRVPPGSTMSVNLTVAVRVPSLTPAIRVWVVPS